MNPTPERKQADKLLFNEYGQTIQDVLGKEQSERGQVLILAAFLDNGLEDILQLVFKLNEVDDKVIRRRLLGNNDRLLFFSFASKILVCRAFNLLSEPEFVALDAIREIRNRCAHSNFTISLSGYPKTLVCLHVV